jgi:hypothetical protein
MSDFVLFVIYLISYYKKNQSISEVARHLLRCLDGEVLLRDNYEIIMRIIISESKIRNLNLYDCLTSITNDEYLQPDLFNVEYEYDKLSEYNKII